MGIEFKLHDDPGAHVYHIEDPAVNMCGCLPATLSSGTCISVPCISVLVPCISVLVAHILSGWHFWS